MARWPIWGERQREFVREILIIILGVLIALAINELADWVRWKNRVAETKARIATQMNSDQAKFRDMIDWAECAGSSLTDLDAVLAEAQANGRLPDIGVLSPPKFGALTDAIWQTTIGNDVAAHMDDASAEAYARYFSAINKLTDEEWRLAQQWARLNPVIHAPGPMTAERIDAVRSAVSELQLLLQARSFSMHQALTEIRSDKTLSVAGARSCRPLMVDLKPYVRKTSGNSSWTELKVPNQ